MLCQRFGGNSFQKINHKKWSVGADRKIPNKMKKSFVHRLGHGRPDIVSDVNFAFIKKDQRLIFLHRIKKRLMIPVAVDTQQKNCVCPFCYQKTYFVAQFFVVNKIRCHVGSLSGVFVGQEGARCYLGLGPWRGAVGGSSRPAKTACRSPFKVILGSGKSVTSSWPW